MHEFMRDGILIHAGINYIFAPTPTISRHKGLDFQHALLEHGVEVRLVEYPTGTQSKGIVVQCESPVVNIRITEAGPGVGQLLVVADQQPGHIDLFAQNVSAIVAAYKATWPTSNMQLVAIDSTIRMLYETFKEHAFKALWEERLGQPEDLLKTLGRSVLGGGLRFVMPPTEEQAEKNIIEVKIESFLQDTSKLFVETQFKWEPTPGSDFEPERRLRRVSDYIENEVAAFMDWKEEGNGNETT
jgi:hypothetical protein